MRAWGKGRALGLRMDDGDKEGPSWGRAPFRGGAGGAGERAEVAVALVGRPKAPGRRWP